VLACPYATQSHNIAAAGREAEVTGPAACTATAAVGGLCTTILVIMILDHVPCPSISSSLTCAVLFKLRTEKQSCCSSGTPRSATRAGCTACHSTACRALAPRASSWAAASLACKLCFIVLIVRCAIPAEGGEAEAVGPEVCRAAAAAGRPAQRHKLAAEHAIALHAGHSRQGHHRGQRPHLHGRYV